MLANCEEIFIFVPQNSFIERNPDMFLFLSQSKKCPSCVYAWDIFMGVFRIKIDFGAKALSLCCLGGRTNWIFVLLSSQEQQKAWHRMTDYI